MEATDERRLAVKFTVAGLAIRSWPAGGSMKRFSISIKTEKSELGYHSRTETKELLHYTQYALDGI